MQLALTLAEQNGQTETQGKKGKKMLIIRFTHSFRERLPEWVTSGIMLMWGLSVFTDPEIFHRTNYAFLGTLLAPEIWGALAILFGFVRLVSLYINGRRKQTPPARMVGAIMGMLIWYGLWLGGMTTGTIFAGGLYFGLAVLDSAALYFASVDAGNISRGGKYGCDR